MTSQTINAKCNSHVIKLKEKKEKATFLRITKEEVKLARRRQKSNSKPSASKSDKQTSAPQQRSIGENRFSVRLARIPVGGQVSQN